MLSVHITVLAAAIAASLTMPLFADHAPADTTAAPAIYRCEIDGTVIFSDRACGPKAQEYESDASRITIYTPPPSASLPSARTQSKARSSRARTSGGSQRDEAKHVASCERIQASLREIRAKMRGGYSAKEGERLKERQAKLTQRRRAERCR